MGFNSLMIELHCRSGQGDGTQTEAEIAQRDMRET